MFLYARKVLATVPAVHVTVRRTKAERSPFLSPNYKTFKKTTFQGINSASLYSLAGRYDNPIPTRFLAPINCLKCQLWALPVDHLSLSVFVDKLFASLHFSYPLFFRGWCSLAAQPMYR